MMTTTHTLSTIEQAVEVGVTLSHSWFRGHTSAFDQLTPRIFREEYRGGFRRELQPQLEPSMMESFQRNAPAVLRDVPGLEEHESWLFLMQHHGTPTRLLDWTESVLVALYFAVAADHDQDAELWAIYPDALNRLSQIPGMPLPGHPLRRYLAGEAALVQPKKLQRKLRLKAAPERPIAIRPWRMFPRMVVQQATFTIHPEPRIGMTIPELITDPKHLVRYVIPAKKKQWLLLHLRFLGVTRATIFPDLEGLSRSVIEEHNIIGYAPPAPPHWSEA